MAKFIFSMESLLNLKSRIEDQKKQEFGKAMGKLEEEREVLNGLSLSKQSAVISLKECASGKVNSSNFQAFNNYIEFIKKKINIQNDVIIQAEDYVEKKRLELVEATKERKMLDKIKEKKYEDYIEEEKQKEQKVIDEIVSYKYS